VSPFWRAFGLLLCCYGIQIEVFSKTPFKRNVHACQDELQCKDIAVPILMKSTIKTCLYANNSSFKTFAIPVNWVGLFTPTGIAIF
jgi:hypothetical protein